MKQKKRGFVAITEVLDKEARTLDGGEGTTNKTERWEKTQNSPSVLGPISRWWLAEKRKKIDPSEQGFKAGRGNPQLFSRDQSRVIALTTSSCQATQMWYREKFKSLLIPISPPPGDRYINWDGGGETFGFREHQKQLVSYLGANMGS